MNILISNDDGVHAQGLKALVDEISKFTPVKVVAPDRNRSGASNSLTLHQPLRITQLENGHYCVEGTPTDCVHVALTGFLDTPIDMVVSGINDGANLGDDILYSGTVAAAMEGRFLGFPAIAISMAGSNIQFYQTGAVIARKLINQLAVNCLPRESILNVNVPDLPLDKIKGIQVTRLGKRHFAEPTVKDHDPRGRPIYWIGPVGAEADAGPGTDFYAVANGYVSVTPIHLDMTHYKIFEEVTTWMEDVNWTL